ncbi:B-cell differentiation antigen CD72-like isoform X2 [Ahaetulla prasina]|uniref:B-cell differentiation antigen CD72-like isoform X2 n=1 Tax=Ahaetulla prasina TaxID=499056 RepID=UPI0026472B41|nr:B-cell differentiation antigen CD72-like isoform X2 [Ahaetulla prasina]XP_058028480.1 B-cell differentiation antigen CD72-like isoform X2 [Ahaetulla prasina]
MFERVTYADLQFIGSPLETSRGEELDEGEPAYENIQGSGAQEEPPRTGQGGEGQSLLRETSRRTEGPAVAQGIKPRKQHPAARTGHQDSAGWSPRTRWAALGVLGISLFLLSVIVSLGVQYMQVSRQLQQAFRDHAAELNSTVEALWHSWAAENWTQQQLQHQELLMDQANRSLALLQRERVSLMANLSQASSCQQIGCCSLGWKLFRWKCLRISDTPKTWEGSQQDCKGSSSHLLILKTSCDAHDVWPSASPERSNHYWIGLKKSRSSFFSVDQTPDIGISMGKKFICEKPARPWP